MIVIGVDVHKRSLTAVAVDEVGRPLAEQTAAAEPLLTPLLDVLQVVNRIRIEH